MENQGQKWKGYSFPTLLIFPPHIIRSLFLFLISSHTSQLLLSNLNRQSEKEKYLKDLIIFYQWYNGIFGATFLSGKGKKPSDPQRKCISKCFKLSSSVKKHVRVEKCSLKELVLKSLLCFVLFMTGI